jgi:uncharacterized protein (DUF1800 family)
VPEDPVWTAASRFGLGLRPGDRAAVEADPRGWLEDQLEAFEGAGTAATTGPFAGLRPSDAVMREIVASRRADEAARRASRQRIEGWAHDERFAWMQAAAASDHPFWERWVAFFANHFTVSVRRPEVTGLAGPFVREAIRAHAGGRFADLLLATTRHPAMLVYLDQARSIGPNSPAGRRSGRGLNENLAREILELHTLGVGSGYTQADVEAFASILTGWGVLRVASRMRQLAGDPVDIPGGFRFEPRTHEPGRKTLLGRTFPEHGAVPGETEGLQALAMLASHPATVRHVCTKLVRHFVADAPPEPVVEALIAAWQDSDGDLREVARALIRCDAAWEAPATKLRSPFELVLAGARAFGWEDDGPAMVTSLQMLGQPLFGAPSPEGWPETAAEWLGPDAVLARVEWSGLLAGQSVGRVRDVGQRIAAVFAHEPELPRPGDPAHRLARCVASPAFQRR